MTGVPRKEMRTRRPADVTIDPMIASPAATLPAGREWIYEARVQGQRALIYKDGPSVSIRARGEPDLESRYPEVTLAVAAIREERAVLDSPMMEAVRTAQEIGLSGVVAKRVDSAYHSGVAHGEWLELRWPMARVRAEAHVLRR